jgi:predicted DNA-binding protein
MNDRLTAFRLPDYMLKRVDDLCKRCKMTRSKFLRWAIIDFFDHHADEFEPLI